ncbi:MAG: cytochrome P460 family protein [Pseudomonadota bacterium]
MKALSTRLLLLGGIGLFVAACQTSNTTQATNCDSVKAANDMSYADAQKVYECISGKMHAGYVKGKKRWVPASIVNNYPNWTKASTAPANPGFHSDRFLVTYVNDIGKAEYLKFADEGVNMPAGSVLVKESFSVNKKGEAVPGPLFIMQKAAAGKSPRTADWYYMMVSAKGVPQGVNVYQACHQCHSGFETQDYMGYPVEEVRAQ